MPFNFRHSPSRKKEPRSWYENALLLAAAGSIIAVIGQLAGTVIPIMYGPQDVSDFSIDINDDVYQIIDVNTTSEGRDVNVGIAVEDLHQSLRPYTFKIQFKAVGPINDTTAIFDPPEIKLQRLSLIHI